MAKQRLLITGASGNLGQDLIARLALFDHYEVVGTTRQDLDLTWLAKHVVQKLDDIKPDVIINTAAFTQVDAAEADATSATRVNAEAPNTLAEWAKRHEAYLVQISTDYVFDGTKGSPYLPADPPHPINHYGQSKYEGEQAVLAAYPEGALVLRTSWLFGPSAKNFIPFLVQAAQQQKPVRVVTDQWGTPTWSGNLCKMLLEILDTRPTGILHGCATGITTRLDQAYYICNLLGAATDFIEPTTTDQFGFLAKRPHNTALQTSFPESALSWEKGIERFLQTQGLLKSHV